MNVTTPAVVTVTAVCPECDESIDIDVDLIASLTVEDGDRTLKVKSKSKAYAHVHGQLALPVDGQMVVEAIVDTVAAGRAHELQEVADRTGTTVTVAANGRTATLSPKQVAAARAELGLDGAD